MKTKTFLIIKTEEQYNQYCNIHEKLATEDEQAHEHELETLEVLIKKWDDEHNTIEELSPLELLKSLMIDHEISIPELANLLEISEAYCIHVVNGESPIGIDMGKHLSRRFKLCSDAFVRNNIHDTPSSHVGYLHKLSTKTFYVHKNDIGDIFITHSEDGDCIGTVKAISLPKNIDLSSTNNNKFPLMYDIIWVNDDPGEDSRYWTVLDGTIY